MSTSLGRMAAELRQKIGGIAAERITRELVGACAPADMRATPACAGAVGELQAPACAATATHEYNSAWYACIRAGRAAHACMHGPRATPRPRVKSDRASPATDHQRHGRRWRALKMNSSSHGRHMDANYRLEARHLCVLLWYVQGTRLYKKCTICTGAAGRLRPAGRRAAQHSTVGAMEMVQQHN